jgi:hypothetical protein
MHSTTICGCTSGKLCVLLRAWSCAFEGENVHLAARAPRNFLVRQVFAQFYVLLCVALLRLQLHRKMEVPKMQRILTTKSRIKLRRIRCALICGADPSFSKSDGSSVLSDKRRDRSLRGSDTLLSFAHVR